MVETSTDRWARFRDTCPGCGGGKSKNSKLCSHCHQEAIDANRKHPKRERNRQSEYDQCPTCDDRKYKKADQCQTCSVERPLKACTHPGCKGQVHRTPPPDWLEEAAEMARANTPCLQIAQRFHAHVNEVRRWLPHAGVLPRECLEEGCDTEVGPGSPYCRKHVARHRKAPGPRVERPENLAELVPPTTNFDSREAYIDGVCEALKIKDWRLSEWMRLDITTLWRLKRDPGIIPSEKTTQAFRDHFRAPMEELVRLRLALEEGQKNPRLVAAGHASIEAQRAEYGEEALKERGRRNMASFRASRTPEQVQEHERLRVAGIRAKLTGKRRTLSKEWRARLRLAHAKRRKQINRVLIREMHDQGQTPFSIAKAMGEDPRIVRREMHMMGLPARLPKVYTTQRALNQAFQIVHRPRSLKALTDDSGREQANKNRATKAEQRVLAAHQGFCEREKRRPSINELATEAGSHKRTVSDCVKKYKLPVKPWRKVVQA